MSPTFEITSVFRYGTSDWEDLGQHGNPPQVVYRLVLAWSDVLSIGQFTASIRPDLVVPIGEKACLLTTESNGQLVVLIDYDQLWKQWDAWLNGERKRQTFGENYRLN